MHVWILLLKNHKVMKEKMLEILMKYITNPYVALDTRKELLDLFSNCENIINNDIELELKQRVQELPDKTTAGEKLYYECGWKEGSKHTKMLVLYSR